MGLSRPMRGIILAGGCGTRLSPATIPVSKILLPVYDRPMIYYPLSTLMLAGIKEILIITNDADDDRFQKTLGDGSQFGISIQYAIQYVPRGIADALIIGEEFIADEDVVLILGDNIFYGNRFDITLKKAIERNQGATIFGYAVEDPERFGVVEFDNTHRVLSLEEKPKDPKSKYAVVGLYVYSRDAVGYAKQLQPSDRGELEITDLNREFLKKELLNVELLEDDFYWVDAGTFESLLDASQFVRNKEKNADCKIMCPEKIARDLGYINTNQLWNWLEKNTKSSYFDKIRDSYPINYALPEKQRDANGIIQDNSQY